MPQTHAEWSVEMERRRSEELEEHRTNLRDQFAMAALTGLIASTLYAAYAEDGRPELAVLAYDLADAMLEARKK